MEFLDQFLVLSPYLASGLVSALVAVALLGQHAQVAGRRSLGGMMLAAALWALLNFFEDASSTLTAKLLFSNLEYLPSAAVCVLFFRFSYQLSAATRSQQSTQSRVLLLLWVAPAVVCLLVWFDPLLGLVRRDFQLAPLGAFFVVNKEYTAVYWAYIAYLYLVVAAGLWLWGTSLWRSRGVQPWTTLGTFAVTAFPLVANILVVLGTTPWPGHDPTPAAFGLFGLMVWVSVGQHRFLSPFPVAGELVMEAWPTPLLMFDKAGRLSYFNKPAAEAWRLDESSLGLTRSEAGSRLNWLPPKPGLGQASRGSAVDEEKKTSWEMNEQPLQIAGRSRGSVVTFHDVSEFEARVLERTNALEDAYYRLSDELQHRRRTEQQLFYYSLHDPLTGLANRSLYLSRLGQCLERYRRSSDQKFGLILLNFVEFKKVNDQLGHGGGDEFLVQAAQRLGRAIRTVDTAARSTADSFLVLLDGVDSSDQLLEAAERLRVELEAPVVIHGVSHLPSLRQGLVWCDEDALSPESLLADAEIALRRCTPSDPCLLFDPRWREDQRDRDQLKNELSRALIQGDLHLVYQPIVCLEDGRIEGYEALARWNHPVRGPVPPNIFVPLAEQEGTIRPLGLWVLREAARFFAEFSRGNASFQHVFLSVNVSPLQLGEPDFAHILLNLLEREALSPSRLHLEITETALVENSETLLPILETLRSHGIQIKLDDFGTGYSSLHSLHRLPVDTLKIDRSFVMELPQGGAIVRTIVGLAQELGLDVVAEGIETVDQKNQLHELGCDAGQGFLFSRAVPPETVRADWSQPESTDDLEQEAAQHK